MKRLIAMLLLAALLLGCVPGLAEDAGAQEADPADLLPTLYITAEYSDATKDGAITGAFLLECRYPKDPSGDASGAPGTVIKIEGRDGINPAKGEPSEILAGDIPCGGSYSFTLKLKYDETLVEEKEEGEEITPVLVIKANSAAIGGCVYTCQFDITPRPRALLLGMNTSPYLLDAYLMKNTLEDLSAEFERFYYDKQEFSASTMIADVSDPGCADFWSCMESFKAFQPDENDVSVLYIDAFTATENGAPLPGISATEGGKKKNVMFDEIFAYLGEHMKGRVIVLVDGRYAGMAVRSFAASGLDEEYYNVIGINMPTAPADTGTQGSPYQGMMARTIALMDGQFYSASYFSEFLSRASNAPSKFLMETTGAYMSAYYAGGGGNLILATDKKYDSGVRILAVKEEKCVIMPLDPLELYYQYLREIAVPAEGLATPGTITGPVSSNIYTGEDHWVDLAAKGGQGFVSAAVNDFDKDGAMDMIAVYALAEDVPFSERDEYVSPETAARIGEGNFCWYLRLYQIIEGEVVMTDSLRGTYMDTALGGYWGDGSVFILESEGMVYISIRAGFIGTNSDDGACGEAVIVQNGKFVPIMEYDPNFNTMEHGAFAYYYDYPHLKDACVLAMFDLPGDVPGSEYKYVMAEYNDLGAILREEIEEHYYEIVVYPDYVAPPFNEAAEAKAAALTGAMQSLFPGEEVTLEYIDDEHTLFELSTSQGIHGSVRCNDDGEITQIWITSPTAPKYWYDKFGEVFQELITLPELGLSEAEITSLPRSFSREVHYESSGGRLTGFCVPDPMTAEWLNLVIYIDQG